MARLARRRLAELHPLGAGLRTGAGHRGDARDEATITSTRSVNLRDEPFQPASAADGKRSCPSGALGARSYIRVPGRQRGGQRHGGRSRLRNARNTERYSASTSYRRATACATAGTSTRSWSSVQQGYLMYAACVGGSRKNSDARSPGSRFNATSAAKRFGELPVVNAVQGQRGSVRRIRVRAHPSGQALVYSTYRAARARPRMSIGRRRRLGAYVVRDWPTLELQRLTLQP